MAGPLPPLINRSTSWNGNWAAQHRYGIPGTGPWSSRYGVTTPSYHQVVYKEPPKRTLKRVDFTRPPTSYLRKDLVSTSLNGKCYYESKFGAVGNNRYQNLMTGRCAPAPTMNQIFPSGEGWSIDLWDKALREMYKNLGDTKVNLGTMLAELGKGISMMERNSIRMLRGLTKFVRSVNFLDVKEHNKFLRGKPGDPWKGAKKVPELWLELVFGWQPLLNEVEGFAQAMAHMVEAGYTPTLSCRGWASKPDPRTYAVNLQSLPTARVAVDVPRHERCLFSTVWLMDEPDARFLGLLGLTNPMADFWELTRYSCLVDYVLPIGNALTGFAAAQGLRYKEGSVTRSRVVGREPGNPRKRNKPQTIDLQTYVRMDDANVTAHSIADLHGFIRGITMERQILGFPPIPPLRLPDIENRLNAKRLANVLAVLSSVCSGDYFNYSRT